MLATKRLARRRRSKKPRTFVILSVAKNPRFKGANSHFDFMDTSPKAQYDKASQYGNLGLCALFCGKEHLNLSVNFIMARDIVTTP